jgi:microcystin-dependent protein
MSQPFVAEIRIMGFNFAPKGWALCNGQLLSISQNTALFSLLGTNFGGDGKSTFGLPNLQGASPIHAGNSQGPGLSQYFIGESGGVQNVTLVQTEMATHNHTLVGDTANASTASPGSNLYMAGQFPGNPAGAVWAYNLLTNTTSLNPAAITFTGGSLPHNNMMPYITLNFCIAMQGVYPARN